MPFKPTSRPPQLRSVGPDRAQKDTTTWTNAGSAERAKLAAGRFLRQADPATDEAPPWGGGRTFSDQRWSNPEPFQRWGEQLSTTFTGTEFQAPPPMDKAETGTALSDDEGPLA